MERKMNKETIHLRSELDSCHTIADYLSIHGLDQFLENNNEEILVVQTAMGNFAMYEAYPNIDSWDLTDFLTDQYAEDLEAGTLRAEFIDVQTYLETYEEYFKELG